MTLEKITGSSMIIKTARALMQEGWAFTPNEMNIIIKAEHPETGESVSFPSFGNLKRWMYERALNYQ